MKQTTLWIVHLAREEPNLFRLIYLSDYIVGGTLGVFLHRFFFELLISSNWGQTWQPPIAVLFATITAAILTTFIAVVASTKKIEKTSIVEVVNAG